MMPLTARDGARLHWTLEGPGDRPTLLLLPPPDGDPAGWDAAARVLLDRFQLLRPDLRAHAAAEGPCEDRATADLARDLLAVMDEAGVARTGVAGVGASSAIAVEMAMLAPGRLEGLALVCTPASMAAADPVGEVSPPTLVIGGRAKAAAAVAALAPVIAKVTNGAQIAWLDYHDRPLAEAPEGVADQLQAFFLKSADIAAAEGVLYRQGIENRRRVLGDPYVDASLARRTPFNTEFQAMITRIAWHEIYSRPGLDVRTRRLVVLAVTASTARWEEFRLHLRAAVTVGGVSRDEIKELLMQLAIYAGVPAANTGFAEAGEILAELDQAQG